MIGIVTGLTYCVLVSGEEGYHNRLYCAYGIVNAACPCSCLKA